MALSGRLHSTAMEVSRDQLLEQVASQEHASLGQETTFVHGESLPTCMHGSRARIHHGLPLVCFRCALSVLLSRAALQVLLRFLLDGLRTSK